MIQILYSLGLLKLTLKRVDKWAHENDEKRLIFALEKGLYNVREKAAEKLGIIRTNNALPFLVRAIDDDIRSVSFAAMNAVEKIGLNKELEQKITEKKEYWKEKEKKDKEAFLNSKRKVFEYKWDRTSKENYENMKEMLKKPLNSGKWF